MKAKAKKIGMTQIWKNDVVVPVTVLKIEPDENQNQSEKTKTNDEKISLFSTLKEGDFVKITGTSKGKGFQGVVKRWGFSGLLKTHGTKHHHRAPGSIGATAPQRVIPGRRMGGHMGFRKVTVKNLKVESIKNDDRMILVKGAVPGMRNTIVEIQTVN